MPAAKIVGEFGGRAIDPPGFDLPIIPFDNGRKVHQLTATNGIVKQTAPWTEPIGSDYAGNIRREPVHSHKTAPAHAACEFRFINTEKTLAHLGVNSVGSDRVRGVRYLAGVEPNLNVLIGLGDANALCAQLERVHL
jgi:hypothetical protein